MKHFNLILALILTMQTAFAGVITDDKLELGKPSSSSDKQLIFKGPTSKTLKSSSAGNLNYNGNGLTVGDGANTADKTITFNKGVNSPSIKYNFATGTIQFSNDNVNFLDMGSGSGGAGGIQMLSDPEFEKATISTYWTPSAGTLTALTSGGNFSGFDKQSASWTPGAASNTLSSETITIVNGLLGARGSASIFYKTTSALHKLQVYDGSTVIAEKLLPANTGYKKEEFTFSIPSSGTIQLRILAGDTTPIYADKAFLGVPSSYPADEDFAVVENLFPNPKAEGSSPSWLAYKDAAGLVPVDGVNGAPTLSCSISSSAPLEKTKSFLITKPASNVQGEGCAHDLKVLSEPYKAKVLQVSFDYKIASGTYTDDTLKLYAYDIDNAQLFELAPTYIKNSSLTEPYRATFQTSLTGTKYRLIWHYAGTDAVATSIKIDNVRVSSQLIATGSFTTDWTSFSPSWGADGTAPTLGNGTLLGRYRYIGDSAEVEIFLSAGSTTTFGSGTYWFTIPFSVDSTKIASPATNGNLGTAHVRQAGVASYNFSALYSAVMNRIIFHGDGANNYWTAVSPFTFAVNHSVSARFTVPVLGKTANTMLSSEYAQRNVGLSSSIAAAQSIPTGVRTKVVFNTITQSPDTLGMLDTSNGRVTVKTPGLYLISGNLAFNTTTNTYEGQAGLHVNGVSSPTKLARTAKSGTASTILGIPYVFLHEFKTGDYFEIFAFQNASGAIDLVSNASAPDSTNLVVQLIGGGATQVVGETTITARYKTAAGQSIANASTSIVDFGTKSFDDLGSVTTGGSWKFTANSPGTYEVCARVRYANGQTWTGTSSYATSFLTKNGSIVSALDETFFAATVTPSNSGPSLVGCDTVKLLTGEYVDVRTAHNEATARTLLANDNHNWIQIKKVGNY